MTIFEALQFSPGLPHLDRAVLLAHVLAVDRVFLMAHNEAELTPAQAKRYRSHLKRAEKHEPIAYIVGEKEFYGRTFSVGPGVLIPRPETELLVERTLERMTASESRIKNKKIQKIAVVDVGTGSGCIIISLVKEFSSRFNPPAGGQDSGFSFFAVDSEVAALRYARKNAKRHAVAPAIQFMKSDLLSVLMKSLTTYDEVFVIANLPYLSAKLYRSTAPNVKCYEPKSALASGPDGLNHYRQLLQPLHALHTAGVKINFLLEISPEQTVPLRRLLKLSAVAQNLNIHLDLTGKKRFLSGLFV
jgi:release factor glutamine methyltransferase